MTDYSIKYKGWRIDKVGYGKRGTTRKYFCWSPGLARYNRPPIFRKLKEAKEYVNEHAEIPKIIQ